jgi:hypothetical protein
MSKVSVDSPEPPRVRHAAGLSRYEREVEERGETTHVETDARYHEAPVLPASRSEKG